MLDLARMKQIRLHARPLGQRLLADGPMRLDYAFPRRTEIVVEGIEKVPQDQTVFLAMNHTDRYNYWPLQYQMHRCGLRYTATWVKGKYYENPMMAWFMDHTNNIPMPSRGHLLSVLFRDELGRVPHAAEYRWLRDRSDELDCGPPPSADASRLLAHLGGDQMPQKVDALFGEMMDEVVRIHRQGIDQAGVHFLVFPEGTRCQRLGRGRIGLAQMSQHLGIPIVPVGCSGSDQVYPGASPFAAGGRVVYRVGKPLAPDGPEIGALRISEPFTPFSRAATRRYGQAFQAITDQVMTRINDLVDPRYQRSESEDEDDLTGAERFV